MPTKKTETTNSETIALRRRMSELSDRIAMLEVSLKKTQELVQEDMTKLAKLVTNK